MFNETTYLAYIVLGAGGCWYQSEDLDKAVSGAIKQMKMDWGHLFNFKKGSTIKVNCFDLTEVTGEFSMSQHGVFDRTAEKYIDLLEIRDITL